MHIRLTRLLPLALLAIAPALIAQSPAPDQPKYLLPPQNIVDAFDAAPLPQEMLSPTRQVMALTYAQGRSPTSRIWRSRCSGSPARA